MKRLWLRVAVGVLTAAGCSADAPAPTAGPGNNNGDVQLPSAVMAQMDALLGQKAARTPSQRKISSALLYAKTGQFAPMIAQNNTKNPDKQMTALTQYDDQGRVLVDIQGRAGISAMAATVEANGGLVVYAGNHSIRSWVPLANLEAIAADARVQAVRPAMQAMTWRTDMPGGGVKYRTGTRAERVAAMQKAEQAWAGPRSLPSVELPRDAVTAAATSGPLANAGSRVSEGDKAHGAARARKFFAVDGTGARVGVLSDSDDFKEQAIATGDLPANTVTVPGQDGRPGGGEGTAMMEIVHDVAPGADLVFATAFNSPESFADNIRTLRFQYHCDVIVDDIIYFFESPYEDDVIAQAVDDVTNDGALYFSSAGNQGNFDDGTSGTWEGDFKPAGALATLPSGYTVHTFGSGVISDRVEQLGGPLILHWADPGSLDNPASANDYDLFVLDEDLRNVVFASTDIQDGTGLAFEEIGFAIPPGARIVIAANPGAELRAIHTVLFGGELALSTTGSTFGHAATADGYGVAAVDVAEAVGGEFTSGPTTPVEVFSADGPRRIFYDRNNDPIVPAAPGGTFASRAGLSLAKPDIAAADGVTTTLPGGSGLNPFFGTSAAAPHAGAIAALVKAAMPALTPAQIRRAIAGAALDIGAAGADRDTGHGIISAFGTLQKVGVKPAVFLTQGAVTVTPLGGATAVLPGGTVQLSVALNNEGGATATAVSATLATTSPDVIVLQGTEAYPTLASGTTSTGAPLFAFFVSPTAPCGESIPFTLTVNYTGNGAHPVVLSFAVQIGRAGATAQRFSYAGPAVAIPDADPTGVDIPLPVSLSGGISSLVFSLDGTSCNTDAGSTTVGVDHTWVGDLTFQLISPTGRRATLIDAAGGTGNSGGNFCQTVLTDGASDSIQGVTIDQAPFTGTFAPLQSLSTFAGDSATGTWLLHVTDSAFLDTGNVHAFSIAVGGFTCGP